MFTIINSKYLYYYMIAALHISLEESCGAMNLYRLRALREDNDLTQQQVAQALGTSQTMYARYERGANELPVRHLITLCKLYNISADYLLGTRPDQSRPMGRANPAEPDRPL